MLSSTKNSYLSFERDQISQKRERETFQYHQSSKTSMIRSHRPTFTFRELTVKRFFLMLAPALAHLLFCAHLLYQAAPLWIATLPLIGLPLLAIRRFPIPFIQITTLLFYTVEWVRTTWLLCNFRMEVGITIHPAIEILVSVTLFTLCSTLVFHSSEIRR